MNVNDQINQTCKKHGFNGVVLLKNNTDTLFYDAFGYFDIENQIPMKKDAIFRIGSITKQFTAVAILQLVEKGLLKLTNPISWYIKNVPYKQEITIHHLLANSSGIANFNPFEDYSMYLNSDDYHEQIIQNVIFKLPLNFEPGERFEYSSSGYFILSYIIEVVTGLPYHLYLHQNIFDPLDMKHSGFHFMDMEIPNFTSLYEIENDQIIKSGPFDLRIASGAGGLYSCAEDLNRWLDGLLSNAILSKSYVDMMMQVQTSINQTGGYGYGVLSVQFEKDQVMHRMVYHPGNGPGVFAQATLYDQALKLIVLSNINDRKTFRAVHQEIESIIDTNLL